jgi:hypothetical protein
MKEMTLTLPDQAYERLVAVAALDHKSPEQWILDRLLVGHDTPEVTTAELPALLAAALDALGFQRLDPEKTRRLSELLRVRKERLLSGEEAAELNMVMTAAEALELESLQRLAAALEH